MVDSSHSIQLSIGGLELSVTGSKEFVEEQFFKLYENHDIEELDPQAGSDAAQNGKNHPGDSTEESGSSRPSNSLDRTLNEYLADSEASTYQDNALVVGWYLEYGGGQDNFTAPEVQEKAHSTKVELGTKPGRDLDKNVQKGYLHSPGERDGSDTYWVTDSGEEYLEELGIPVPE